MKIQKLRIKNFGILADVSFDFSGPGGSFAFVNGRNGRGKTSLLGALKWCLLGEEPAGQYISRWAVGKARPGKTLPVEVEIDLLLDDGESTASIRRNQLFEVVSPGKTRRLGDQELSVKSRDAAGFLTSPEVFPEDWLERHFPRRLKNFFLFDGELMKNFFDAKVQTAIADSVREIAGVDKFEAIANKLMSLHSGLNQKIAKLAGGRAQAAESKYAKESNFLAELVLIRVNKEADLVTAKEVHRTVTEARKASELTVEQASRSQELVTLIENLQANRMTANEEFGQEALRRGVVALFHSSFTAVDDEYNRAKAAGIAVPPRFDPSEIQKLLDESECICGSHIVVGSAEEECLLKIISESSTASQIGKLLAQTSREIEILRGSLPEGWALVKIRNDKISTLTAEYERLKIEQQSISGGASSAELLAAGDLSRKQASIEAEIDELQRDLGSLNDQISRLEPTVERLYKEFERASAGESGAEELQRQAAFALELATAAKNIHGIALGVVRERLESAMNEKFSIIKEGSFSTIITNDFEVQTVNQDGSLASLSEGEQMMKAYIFSIVLREVMALGFPLVVDTPFGRLDVAHQEELAQMLVHLVDKEVIDNNRQAIFLMHDGEYTPYTRMQFSPANPLETYLAYEVDNDKSIAGLGIDPVWYNNGAWKDFKAGKIQ